MTVKHRAIPKLRSRNFIIDKGGQFHLTNAGIKKFRDRLHSIGVDIASIDTLDRYIQAYKVLQAIEVKQFKDSLEELPYSIEKKWLYSIFNDNRAEKQRLEALLIRKSDHRLKIIK